MEAGAAAAAATTGVGLGLFSYNRGNYQFDQKQHYTRFTAGMNMAIAQTGLYRQDIAQLTELTVTRQDCYHGIAAMGLTILTAIYCPGRVGLHTPPPPGWLMGLEFVNIAGCYMFLGLCLWFAMHASMRADTAATHMLTRFVRLPIPTQGMLDKARKFLSSYEEQPLSEVLRIPFTRHQGAGKYKEGGFNEDFDIDDEAKKRTRHGYDVPSWYRKEKAVDNNNNSETIGTMMPLDAQGSAPEHFEAYRELQMEWFPYDVYCRISMFLAFMHLIHCWAYLQIGHLLQEDRAVWACAIVMLPMFVLQQVILTLDIVPSSFPVHRVGPFGLWFAFVAACIEYQRWYSPTTQAFGFALVYVAYIIHIVYTLSLLRICAPAEDVPVVAESPGASWWPGEWRLPTAFQHAVWLVAPPKELPQGQVDIVGELRSAQRSSDALKSAAELKAEAAEAKRRDVHRALGKQGESPAWLSVKTGLIALVIAWVWLTLGFTIEVMNQGTTHPSLLNAFGLPNNLRDPRYRPAKPGAHEPTEVGTGGIDGPARGVHMESMFRRLSVPGMSLPVEREQLAGKLRELLPMLQEVARGGGVAVPAKPVAPAPEHQDIEWPPMFEPEFLVCGEHKPATLALSQQGRGAYLPHGERQAKVFSLRGVVGRGAVLAANWDASGLHLVTTAGSVLSCPGDVEADAKLSCEPLSTAKLPLGVGFSGSIAITNNQLALRVAVKFNGEDSITVFSHRHGGNVWLPTGEVRSPEGMQSAAFADEGRTLVLRSERGAVSHMRMDSGEISEVEPANSGYDGYVWKSVCRCHQGHARLATPEGKPRFGARLAAKFALA